jgi:hypothetical protein
MIEDESPDYASETTLQVPVVDLETTYVAKKSDQPTRYDSQLQKHVASGSNITNLFLAIDGIDQRIEIGKLLRRIYCYVFAELHPKGTSVEHIVQDIHNVVSPSDDTRKKVYRFLHMGTKWGEIISLFTSITNVNKQKVLGLLTLLQSGSL